MIISSGGLKCGIALFMLCADNWLDPSDPVTLKLTSNATSPLRVGQKVQLICTANNFTGILSFFRVVGNTETREHSGYSGFFHTITLTDDDNGSEWYCGTKFSRTLQQTVGPRTEFFFTSSNRLPIRLEGVTQLAKPPSREGQAVHLKVTPVADAYNASGEVSWLCEAENIKTGFMEMRQGKGILERNIYVGYQIKGGYRWVDQYLTPGDDTTFIYCSIYIWEWERRTGYSINGPRKYLDLKT